MAQRQDERNPDMKMDPAALYREDVFTDRKIGVIRRLTPVRSDGSDDPSRQVLYSGETQILTSVGPLPVNFEIEAGNLGEAASRYAEAAKAAVERTVKDLQDLRRQAASSIVVPQGGMGGLPGGGLPGGGLGGGGKIQIP
ncbi:MAG: hypothetical protein IT529_15570 [Burkholderiales bacterium]|nr:hypothetical protein [Burkholderiales bacterium]